MNRLGEQGLVEFDLSKEDEDNENNNISVISSSESEEGSPDKGVNKEVLNQIFNIIHFPF